MIYSFFKIIFWFSIATENYDWINYASNNDFVYIIIKNELINFGWFDVSEELSKGRVGSNCYHVFKTIKGLDLPDHGLVHGYAAPLGEDSFYWRWVKINDRFRDFCTFQEMLGGSEAAKWSKIKETCYILRNIYDKLDDLSRANIPLWQKRVRLMEVRNILGYDNYNSMVIPDPLPIYLFQRID